MNLCVHINGYKNNKSLLLGKQICYLRLKGKEDGKQSQPQQQQNPNVYIYITTKDQLQPPILKLKYNYCSILITFEKNYKHRNAQLCVCAFVCVKVKHTLKPLSTVGTKKCLRICITNAKSYSTKFDCNAINLNEHEV